MVQTTIQPWGRSLIGFAIGATLLTTTTACKQADNSARAASAAVPVQLTTVETATVETSSEFVGNLEAASKVQVRAESQGRIRSIAVTSGQTVASGSLLMVLEPDQTKPQVQGAEAGVLAARAARDAAVQGLQIAKAQQATAQSNMELQKTNFERAKFLLEQGAIGQYDYDRAKHAYEATTNSLKAANKQVDAAQSSIRQAEAGIRQAQAQVNTSKVGLGFRQINAPIAGMLGDLPVKLGDFVSPGQEIANIARNDQLNLRLSVPSNQSAQLKMGTPVELLDPNSRQRLATGQISFISPTVNSGAQMLLAKARFANPTGNLRDGQYVQARVIWRRQPGVLVPTVAVSSIGGKNFVYLADTKTDADGKSQPIVRLHPVTLGAIQGNSYQVLTGLKPGDTIATTNILRLRDNAPIQPAS